MTDALMAAGFPVALMRSEADGYALCYVASPQEVLVGGYQRGAATLDDLTLVDLAYLLESGVRGDAAERTRRFIAEESEQ